MTSQVEFSDNVSKQLVYEMFFVSLVGGQEEMETRCLDFGRKDVLWNMVYRDI